MKISHLRKIMQELPPNAKPMDHYWRTDYIRSMGMEPGDIYQELEMESRFADMFKRYGLRTGVREKISCCGC